MWIGEKVKTKILTGGVDGFELSVLNDAVTDGAGVRVGDI